MREQVDKVNQLVAGPASASAVATTARAAATTANDATSATAATPSATADAVMDLVHRLMHRFRALQYQGLRDGPQAVTHMESKVLGFFARHPGATASALAEHSGRDKAQLARLLKRLVDVGLLERVADETDRRHQRLSLTPAGMTIQDTLQQQHRRLAADAVAGLDKAEQAQLLALLQRVNDRLEAGPSGAAD
jgi:DNA-binding MarR family transcriptional regulator